MYERSEPLVTLRAPEAGGPARGLIVFGAPRGGTSMVAGALRILGADLGARQGDGNNEDLDMLAARGELPQLHADHDGALARLRGWLAGRVAAKGVWGWKDPHGAYYAADLLSDLPAPRLLGVFRDPVACAERVGLLTGKDHVATVRETLKLYAAGMDLLEKASVPSGMISYEKALVRPKRFLVSLAKFAGLEPSREQFEKALVFISPERGHGNPDTMGWPREGAL
jgi:hypothetical protein